MIVIVLGALFGAGLVALAYGLFPPRPALADVLTALDRPPATVSGHATPAVPRKWAHRAGLRAVPVLRRLGLPPATLAADVTVAEKDMDQHLAEKAAAAAVGLTLPWTIVGLVRVGAGVELGWWMPTAGCLVTAGVFFLAPDLAVRQLARQRRAQLRHTLSVVLDLTVISLAGGAGVHQALHEATMAPSGWAAGRLRRCLTTAQLTRTGPWQHLAELGEQTGVADLCELAATVALAGSEGARVRASLSAKSRAMRRRQLSEADGAAQAATERMSLPVVLLFAAFMIFIGYPALAHVLASM